MNIDPLQPSNEEIKHPETRVIIEEEIIEVLESDEDLKSTKSFLGKRTREEFEEDSSHDLEPPKPQTPTLQTIEQESSTKEGAEKMQSK